MTTLITLLALLALLATRPADQAAKGWPRSPGGQSTATRRAFEKDLGRNREHTADWALALRAQGARPAAAAEVERAAEAEGAAARVPALGGEAVSGARAGRSPSSPVRERAPAP